MPDEVVDLAGLGPDDFAPWVGDPFTVDCGEALALTLVAVRRSEHRGATREQFALSFAGPDDPGLLQGTWRLHHEVMGTLELFLVPAPGAAGSRSYDAVFA